MVIPKGNHSIQITQKNLPFVPFDVSFQRDEDKPIDREGLILSVGQTNRGTGMFHLSRLFLDENNDHVELTSLVETEKPVGIKCCLPLKSIRNQVLLGDFQGTLSLWNLERLQENPLYSWKAHERLIHSIDVLDEMSIVSGSRDGSAKIWDLRTKSSLPVVKIDPENEIDRSDCWTVSGRQQRLMIGFANGDVRLFDMRNRNELWKDNMASGVPVIRLANNHQQDGCWTVGTVDGQIHFFHEFCDHHRPCRLSLNAYDSTVWSLRQLTNKIWVTGGGDGLLKFHRCEHDNEGSFISTLFQQSLTSSSPLAALDTVPFVKDRFLLTTVSFDKKLFTLIYSN
jgi:WD40 repeat protein